MKFFILSFALILSCSVALSAPLTGDAQMSSIITSIKQTTEENECRRANICFTIDGSGAVTSPQFKAATKFVQDTVTVLNAFSQDAKYAANQFGRIAYQISPLTSNQEAFVKTLEDSTYRNNNDSAVGSGIVFCDTVLRIAGAKVNKMVVITDGRNDFGGDPITRANNFRSNVLDGQITSVAIGNNVDLHTLRKISDTSILHVDDYFKLGLFVKQLANTICQRIKH